MEKIHETYGSLGGGGRLTTACRCVQAGELLHTVNVTQEYSLTSFFDSILWIFSIHSSLVLKIAREGTPRAKFLNRLSAGNGEEYHQ